MNSNLSNKSFYQKTTKVAGILFIFAVLLISSSINSFSSDKKLPSVKVKNLKGETVSTDKFSNDGKPMIINFWATWCKPCILELNNINEDYAKWQKETGVKIIAISIDDSRNSKKVAPFVNGRGWEYEVYIDENSDFRRALNVNNPPQTFLLDGKGNIVYTHNGYAPGDEKHLYEEVKKLIGK